MAVVKWLRGKKTYAIAAAIIVVAGLNEYGIAVPEYAWTMLAALGLAFLRAGVNAVNSVGVKKK